MSPAAIISIALAGVVVLAGLVFVTAAKRSDVRGAGALSRETVKRDRDSEIDLPAAPTGRAVERAAVEARSAALVPAAPSLPEIWIPPDRDAIGVSRRQFLNRATVSLMGAGLTTFAAGSFVGMLWPQGGGGFGGKVNIGKLTEVLGGIRSNSGFLYVSNARAWVTAYPADAVPKAKGVKNYEPLLNGLESGLVALWQKCPHLGCRVPDCKTSQWFECPCHGSQYNRVGEKKAGPAPRGMDHFLVSVTGSGDVVIDTATPFPGVPIGTNTTGQEAEGPHCVSGGEGGH
jgi:cytochrome b6-f complex iron-sulfur subunit